MIDLSRVKAALRRPEKSFIKAVISVKEGIQVILTHKQASLTEYYDLMACCYTLGFN